MRKNEAFEKPEENIIWPQRNDLCRASCSDGRKFSVCYVCIPVGDEGKKAASVLGVPDGYMIPCYIGIGIEQVEQTVESTLHFGKW